MIKKALNTIKKFQQPAGKLFIPHVDYLGIPYRSDGNYDYFGAHPESTPKTKTEH